MTIVNGLLLINLGSPAEPTTGAVRTYLRQFLSDPRVIDINPVGRAILLNAIILPFRPAKSAAAYRHHSQGNVLLLNGRGGAFRDVSEASGTALGRWGWGALFADLNNDGWEDIYAPNGFITNREPADVSSFFWRRVVGQSPPLPGEPTKQYRNAWESIQHMVMGSGSSWARRERNCVYLSLGGVRFADASYVSGGDFPDDSRAVAAVDWDDDGRLDLMLKSRTAPRLRFLRNVGPAARWLKLDLRGTRCNRDAIGATVLVDLGPQVLRKTLYAGDGYLAQSSKRLHFGLGEGADVRSVSVRWPGGEEERYEPRFTFHGFQYVEVRGLGHAPRPGELVGLALTSDVPFVGTLTPIELVRFRIVVEQRPVYLDGARIVYRPEQQRESLHGSSPLILLSTCPTMKPHHTKKVSNHVR